jgi:16S rRNA A1518/A1519 N6-dimethyltransferase RsmA/KsgA/DIM1 with predicted DNA glycosylase/AP lyase activity
LLLGWLTDRGLQRLDDLMFQKEAERIVAPPPESGGLLSVLGQRRCEVRKLFDVNRSATSAQGDLVNRPPIPAKSVIRPAV